MNKVLELQKLANKEGKGKAAEGTVTVVTVTVFLSTVSNHC